MDNFIKDMVFSIYDNELIKSKKDLHTFLKKFITTLQTYEYDSIDLNETSSEESLNGEIFICDIGKNGCK